MPPTWRADWNVATTSRTREQHRLARKRARELLGEAILQAADEKALRHWLAARVTPEAVGRAGFDSLESVARQVGLPPDTLRYGRPVPFASIPAVAAALGIALPESTFGLGNRESEGLEPYRAESLQPEVGMLCVPKIVGVCLEGDGCIRMECQKEDCKHFWLGGRINPRCPLKGRA